jgi:hypothetical protein
VLTKRLKLKVRSDKRLGLDLGVKDLIFLGGYSQDLQDTIFRSNHYRILQGLLKKKTPSSSLGRNRGQGRPRLRGAAPVTWRPTGSVEGAGCKGEGGKSRRRTHQWRRPTGGADFSKGTA